MTPEEKASYAKIMDIVLTAFEHVKDKFVSAQTAAEVSDCITAHMREGALSAFMQPPDELKFDYSDSDSTRMKLKPADRYTAFVMYCSLNGIPLTFNRADCPERIVLGNGVILTYNEDKGQIGVQVPRPVDYIEIKFMIDNYGDVGGINVDHKYKTEPI